jgi:hypothetical protein
VTERSDPFTPKKRYNIIMSELQTGSNPESSLEEASRLFCKLANVALQQSVWTPWQRCRDRGRSRRDRNATHAREVSVGYSSIIRPRHHDPSWAGPIYTLEEELGKVSRILTVSQHELAPRKRNWLRSIPPIADSTKLHITFTNKETKVPEFKPPSELAGAESAALEPYGGGVHQVVFDHRALPEAQYTVERTGESLQVQEYGQRGSFTQDFATVEALQGLVAVNRLLREEVHFIGYHYL